MNNRFGPSIIVIVLCFATIVGFGQSPITIEWEEIPALPDSVGFNGSFIGVVDDCLLVAGGANFPESPVWEGGKKKWYNTIYILRKEKDGSLKWLTNDQWTIPQPIGYGVAVETDEGLLCFGGSNEAGVSSSVFRIHWDVKKEEIEIEEVGKMPVPLTSMGGALLGNKVYLAGGFDKDGGAATGHFLSFDLYSYEWNELPTWPGPPRINPVVVSQSDGAIESLFLFSGRDYNPEILTPHTLHSDVYSYNPHAAKWKIRSAIPDNSTPGISKGFLGAAPAVAIGGSHIMIFGGAGGKRQELLHRMEIAHTISDLEKDSINQVLVDSLKNEDKRLTINTRFSRTIWAYHTITDTWVKAAEFPGESQAVTSATQWNDQVIITGGEVGPGVRTTRGIAFNFVSTREYFGWLNYLTLSIYLCIIVLIGWFFSRRNKTTADYFLGGNRIPWWAAGLSIYATQLSAITYLAIPALAYAFDWQAFLGMFGILIMAPIVIKYYLPHFKKEPITTAYEFLERRFNLAVRLIGSLSFILFQVVRMGIVVYLPALAISSIIGLDIYVAIGLMGFLAIVYTVLGGIEAVIWTDALQVLVLIGGVFVSLFFIAVQMGGVSEIIEVASSENKFNLFDWRLSSTEVVTWSLFIGSFALNIAPYTTDQSVVQRYLSTKNTKAAKSSIWLNGIISIPASSLIFLLGTFLFVFYKAHPENLAFGMENDKIFPLFISHELPAGIAGLVVAGIFSASMSSLDSSMHSISTVFTVDFYQRFNKTHTNSKALSLAKFVTVISGTIGTIIACYLAVTPRQSVFFLFQEVIGLFGSAIAGIFILGVFSKKATSTGAIMGAIASLTSVVLLKYYTSFNFYIYPIVGIPICVLVGLMFRADRGKKATP